MCSRNMPPVDPDWKQLATRSKRGLTMSTTSEDGENNGNSAGHELPQHLNWETIPVEQPADGIERQLFIGNRMMMVRFRFRPFLVTPQHDHPHEQMTIVERGRVRFFIEGKEK